MNASEITADLFRRLRLRSNGSGVVLLCEVGDGAGFGNRGWSDAISMQTWPSKTLTITGYEVKATRSDWLRELDEPEKNAAWQKQCHEWYVVAPKDVIVLEELPTGWGLLVPRGEDGLRIAARSEKTGDDAVSLGLMAAVFRAAANERRRLEKTARWEIQQEECERVAERMERLEREAKDWESRHVELVEALGGYRWENFDKLKKLATAVREVENGDDPKELIRQLRKKLQRTAEKLLALEVGL